MKEDWQEMLIEWWYKFTSLTLVPIDGSYVVVPSFHWQAVLLYETSVLPEKKVLLLKWNHVWNPETTPL